MKGTSAGLGGLLVAVGLGGCLPSADSRQPGAVSTMPAAIRGPSDSLVCASMTDARFSAAEPLSGRGRIALLRQRRGDGGCETEGAPDLAGARQWIARTPLSAGPDLPTSEPGPMEPGQRLSLVEPSCTAARPCVAAMP